MRLPFALTATMVLPVLGAALAAGNPVLPFLLLSIGLVERAARDVTVRIDRPLPEGFDGSRTDFSAAADALAGALAELLGEAEDLKAEAAATNTTDALAMRLERQAHRISDTAGLIRLLNDSFAATVTDAATGRHRADAAVRKAEESGAIVDRAIAAMSGVRKSSTAESEVKALIARSSTEVAGGATFVDEAGTALRHIVETISAAHDMTDALDDRAWSQANKLSTPSETLGDIDGSTQANAAQTKELAATAARVATSAETARILLPGFTLPPQGGSPPALRGLTRFGCGFGQLPRGKPPCVGTGAML